MIKSIAAQRRISQFILGNRCPGQGSAEDDGRKPSSSHCSSFCKDVHVWRRADGASSHSFRCTKQCTCCERLRWSQGVFLRDSSILEGLACFDISLAHFLDPCYYCSSSCGDQRVKGHHWQYQPQWQYAIHPRYVIAGECSMRTRGRKAESHMMVLIDIYLSNSLTAPSFSEQHLLLQPAAADWFCCRLQVRLETASRLWSGKSGF